MKLRNIYLILVLVLCLQCEKSSPAELLSLSQVKKEFPPSTQFKSIKVLPHSQTVVILPLNEIQNFKEFKFNNGTWTQTALFESQILGNVETEDFLFALSDSLENFVNQKLDSLRHSSTIEAIKLETNDNMYELNPIRIQIRYNQKMRDKTFTAFY